METEGGTYGFGVGDGWSDEMWNEGDETPDPSSNGISEVDPCSYNAVETQAHSEWWESEWPFTSDPSDSQQWGSEWPYMNDEWGDWGEPKGYPTDNQEWHSESPETSSADQWGEPNENWSCEGSHEWYDDEWFGDYVWWGENDEKQEWVPGPTAEHVHTESIPKTKQAQYYGQDGTLLPATMDGLVAFLGERGWNERIDVSTFLEEIPHEDYFQLLVQEARQHADVGKFVACMKALHGLSEEEWTFLGDGNDDLEDMADFIHYLVSPDHASKLLQDKSDLETKASGSCVDDWSPGLDGSPPSTWDHVVEDDVGSNYDSATVSYDVDGGFPEPTKWTSGYEGYDPWWGEGSNCLEDLVTADDQPPYIPSSDDAWWDEHDPTWEDHSFHEWNDPKYGETDMVVEYEPEKHDMFTAEDFIAELEMEFEKTTCVEPCGPTGATPAEDPYMLALYVFNQVKRVSSTFWHTKFTMKPHRTVGRASGEDSGDPCPVRVPATQNVILHIGSLIFVWI